MPDTFAPEPRITVWQPKPTRTIDWTPYGPCDTCGAQPATTCLNQRISNRNTTGKPPARFPHKGRPRTYTPTPRLDRAAAIAELLATAAAATALGVDLDPRDALHALGVTDVEIRAAEQATRQP